MGTKKAAAAPPPAPEGAATLAVDLGPPPTNLRLYDYAQELVAIREAVDEAEGELSEELEKRLDETTEGLEKKVETIALFTREDETTVLYLQGLEAGLKAELDRVARRRKAAERAVKSWKSYLERCLGLAELEVVQTRLLKVRRLFSAKTVRGVVAEEKLWELRSEESPFVRVIPEAVELDAAAVAQAIEAGQELPEALAHLKLEGTPYARIY